MVLRIAKNEYRKWFFNGRMLLLLSVLVVLNQMVIVPLEERAKDMEYPLNLLEGYVGICNSKILLLLLPLIFIVMLSDYPKMDENMLFYISRTGISKWIYGQLLFLAMADGTILLFIGGSTILPQVTTAFFYNGWSEVVLLMQQRYPELSATFISNLIPANIYFQMLPYKAVIYSTLLYFLYFYFLGVILLLFRIAGKKILGILLDGFLLLIGAMVTYFEAFGMWCLPAAHANLAAHYSTYYREMIFPLWHSLIYFLLFIGAELIFVKLIESNIKLDTFLQGGEA